MTKYKNVDSNTQCAITVCSYDINTTVHDFWKDSTWKEL